MKLFLLKAIFIGFLGAVLGYFIGFSVASILGGQLSLETIHIKYLAIVIVFAPVLALIAAYIPATIAARQDPAEVLREE